MAKQVIIKGTPVVAANEVLVADSNSKIPAVDGSLVTAMSGTNVGSGTIATARLDTGTAANKIVVLDGSAKIPAVDGSLLTGIVSYTKSASDPTISTNPSGGVGTEWVNHTTGKQFVCTDATAGANVWSCSGSHSGDVNPWVYPGVAYGYYMGGAESNMQTAIQQYSYTSDGNTTDVGDLTDGRYILTGATAATHGYSMGGDDGASPSGGITNIIDKFAFATHGAASDVGDLTVAREAVEGASSFTHGYCFGGYASNVIDKFTFSADANATDVADLSAVRNNLGVTSITHGYTGGYGAPAGNVIEKFPFATDSNSADVGDLTVARGESLMSCSDTTHGYAGGGRLNSSTYYNVIDRWTFASDANASDVGDLTLLRSGMGSGTSSTTYGYTAGGWQGPPGETDRLEIFQFAASSNATDVGNLIREESSGAGCQV